MRLAILADIHGNLPALEAVLADIPQHGVEGIVVAGDSTAGPQQGEVLDLLRSLGSWQIRGNSENYLLALDAGAMPEAWSSSEQWATVRWSYQHLAREDLDWIASLPEQRTVRLDGVAPIRVVHGSLRGPSEHLFPDRHPAVMRLYREQGMTGSDQESPSLDRVLAHLEEPVLICGHSHIPWTQAGDGWLVLNPGSVGAPNNGDPRAQYALLTWQGEYWQARHRAIAYDLERIRVAYQESGLLAAGGAFARACLLGIVSGQNVPGHFVSHAHGLAAEAGTAVCGAVPDRIWQQAVATFDWEAGRARLPADRSMGGLAQEA